MSRPGVISPLRLSRDDAATVAALIKARTARDDSTETLRSQPCPYSPNDSGPLPLENVPAPLDT